MILAILIFSVISTLLSFLALAALGKLFVETRDKFDSFLGFAEFGIRSYAELDSKVQSSLDCLVTTDAALDIVKTSQGSGVPC